MACLGWSTGKATRSQVKFIHLYFVVSHLRINRESTTEGETMTPIREKIKNKQLFDQASLVQVCNPRPRQAEAEEDHELQTSLGYRVGLCLRKS